jgi:hypothetical protein
MNQSLNLYKKIMKLSVEEFESSLTEYIRTVWCKEDFQVHYIEIEQGKISCLLRTIIVHEPYLFTAVQTIMWIEKIWWAYCMWENNLKKLPPGEGYIRELKLKYKKQIRERNNIQFVLSLKKKIQKKDYQYHIFDVDVQNGSMIGTVALVFPQGQTHISSDEFE